MLPSYSSLLRRWWLPLGVAVLSTVLQLAGLRDAWQFDRALIASGDWWLLLSGNLVHLNTNHLLMNVLGLGVIALLVWPYLSTPQWLLCFAVSALAVGVGLYWRDTHLGYYVGLSGVLHGLLLAGVVYEVAVQPRSGWVLLIAIVAKLGWEQWHGAVPGSEWAVGGSVVVNSHLYGAIAGGLMGLVFVLRRSPTPGDAP